MPASLTLVKAEAGEYHRVWITPDDGDPLVVTLHVRHDLPHLVVESLLDIEWGLWAELVLTGQYPGLTESHLAAKAITNAIVAAGRYGSGSAADARTALAASARPEAAARQGYDHQFALRVNKLVDERLAVLTDAEVAEANRQLERILDYWMATPPGEQMRLTWPLDDGGA